ncbi:MAG: CPBP family intramembrane metalloprotease [Natronospirillum sp.]
MTGQPTRTGKLFLLMACSWLTLASGLLSYESINSYANGIKIDAATLHAYVGLVFSLLIISMTLSLFGKQVLLGEPIGKRQSAIYCLYGIPFMALAIAIIYLVYLPLEPYLPNWTLGFLADSSFDVFKDSTSTHTTFLLVLESSVLAPIWEELVFRGALLLTLAQWRYIGKAGAAVISSLLFASLHADIITTFIFGILLCAITFKTRSLWPAILIHISYNSLVGLYEWWDPAFPIFIVYLPFESSIWDAILDILVVPVSWGLANALVASISLLWLFLWHIPHCTKRRDAIVRLNSAIDNS